MLALFASADGHETGSVVVEEKAFDAVGVLEHDAVGGARCANRRCQEWLLSRGQWRG